MYFLKLIFKNIIKSILLKIFFNDIFKYTTFNLYFYLKYDLKV